MEANGTATPEGNGKITASEGMAAGDSRAVVGYLLRPESDDYIAIMDILEASVTDLTAAEIGAELGAAGRRLPGHVVEARLDALKECGAVSARSDTSRARRYTELLARNWRYTASPTGRQVQRFYRTVLAASPQMREIPVRSLHLFVTELEKLATELTGALDPAEAASRHVDATTIVFTNHDNLDAALVGAEDALTSLADRFDLDDEHTGELKGLLVDYATRIAAELDRGSARAAAALDRLAPHFASLASAVVAASEASELIAVGALTASRGGRADDWTGLRAWCDARTGRAARFSLRLVRTLPSMHANLRRLHSSTGTATNRSRALAFARAVLTDGIGTQVFQAATGDHAWRKLYGTADEDDAGRNPSWRGGPQVPVPALLRTQGRTGARGRGAAPRDDTEAKAQVTAARQRRQQLHEAAVAEVLAHTPGRQLEPDAARVALASLMAAARAGARGSHRTGLADGLACTLIRVDSGIGVLLAETWRVILPGRIAVFHLPGRKPTASQLDALAGMVRVRDTEGTVPVSRATAGGSQVHDLAQSFKEGVA